MNAIPHTGRTVVIAERRMDPALAELVRQACARASVDCFSWNGVERLDGMAGRAALALGVLPAGLRRIPGELSRLITDQLPGLPLLLLAEEPLVRPLVSLHDGLITLLEGPPSVNRLASCTRSLLAERASVSQGALDWWPITAVPGGDGQQLERCEYQIGRCWLGALDRSAPEQGAGRRVPWLQVDQGLTVMLTAADYVPPETSGSPPDLHTLGCAVQLHLEGDRPEWVFHGAQPDDVVALLSEQRLPVWTDLGQRIRRLAEPLRIPAVQGDLVVAFNAAAGSAASDAQAALADGGPAVLDSLEAELGRSRAPFACLVVELR